MIRMIAKEILKLGVCPLCHETHGVLRLLSVPLQYRCRRCCVQWGEDYVNYMDVNHYPDFETDFVKVDIHES